MGQQYNETLNTDAQNRLTSARNENGKWITDVQLTGSTVDLRGTAANKPDPTTVTVGATYWSIDTDPNAERVEVSDGTQWVVMV